MEFELTIKAKAKLNLFLHIIRKNQDSYHSLESLVMFTDDLFDIIKVKKNDKLILEIDGEFSKSLSINDNLILKAATYLRGSNNFGAYIKLTKNIPLASGLGGGSSDAASVIKLLLKIWDIKLTDKIIFGLKSIGADVPCCYYGKAAYFSGIGEIIEPLSLAPRLHALIIFPQIEVSTEHVFKKITTYDKPLNNKKFNFDNANLFKFLSTTQNSMESVVINTVPEIKNILDILKNIDSCQLTRMSGSGSSCFALFTTERDAKEAYRMLKANYNWWIKYSLLS